MGDDIQESYMPQWLIDSRKNLVASERRYTNADTKIQSLIQNTSDFSKVVVDAMQEKQERQWNEIKDCLLIHLIPDIISLLLTYLNVASVERWACICTSMRQQILESDYWKVIFRQQNIGSFDMREYQWFNDNTNQRSSNDGNNNQDGVLGKQQICKQRSSSTSMSSSTKPTASKQRGVGSDTSLGVQELTNTNGNNNHSTDPAVIPSAAGGVCDEGSNMYYRDQVMIRLKGVFQCRAFIRHMYLKNSNKHNTYSSQYSKLPSVGTRQSHTHSHRLLSSQSAKGSKSTSGHTAYATSQQELQYNCEKSLKTLYRMSSNTSDSLLYSTLLEDVPRESSTYSDIGTRVGTIRKPESSGATCSFVLVVVGLLKSGERSSFQEYSCGILTNLLSWEQRMVRSSTGLVPPARTTTTAAIAKLLAQSEVASKCMELLTSPTGVCNNV